MGTVKKQTHKEKYHDYLQSDEWRRIAWAKKWVRGNAGCEMCGDTKRLQVHHNTYERVFEERPEDLTVVCRKCHKRHHEIKIESMEEAISRTLLTVDIQGDSWSEEFCHSVFACMQKEPSLTERRKALNYIAHIVGVSQRAVEQEYMQRGGNRKGWASIAASPSKQEPEFEKPAPPQQEDQKPEFDTFEWCRGVREIIQSHGFKITKTKEWQSIIPRLSSRGGSQERRDLACDLFGELFEKHLTDEQVDPKECSWGAWHLIESAGDTFSKARKNPALGLPLIRDRAKQYLKFLTKMYNRKEFDDLRSHKGSVKAARENLIDRFAALRKATGEEWGVLVADFVAFEKGDLSAVVAEDMGIKDRISEHMKRLIVTRKGVALNGPIRDLEQHAVEAP